MFGLGFGELILIFLIALIFIGPKKLPELAKGLGQGIKEFQKAAKGFTDNFQDMDNHHKPQPMTPSETQKIEEAHQIADAIQQQETSVVEVSQTDSDKKINS
jgi:sec-independent protein translocase protein TatA